jgi:hypothetical protein
MPATDKDATLFRTIRPPATNKGYGSSHSATQALTWVATLHTWSRGPLSGLSGNAICQEPERWLRLHRTGSRNGWRDMAAFAGRQHDEALRERLERAIEGKGAFFRFRDIVHGENLSEQWYAFSIDRQMGRSREFLADNGIRVG